MEQLPYAEVVSEDKRTLPRIYKVWFGTNRNLLPVAAGQIPFGIDRSKDIHHGMCEVNIPKSHKIGSVGSGWWTRLRTWTDDRLKLLSTTVQNSNAFWTGIVDELRDLSRQNQMALIYIHGFNVSFEGAAIRAAQIGFDLEVPGLTAFFSWPSKGTVAGYIADGNRVNASEKAMTEFIRGFVEKANVEQVHLLAHSMGNRALLRSIERVVEGLSKKVRRRIGQVILAAPDVGCDEFCDLAVVYKKIAKRTTMYVSAKDLALKSSGIINEYARAGFVPPVTVVPGIDTIEATNVDLTLLGHSHYAEARALITDMNVLINTGAPPMKRHGLLRLTTDDGQIYWQVRG